MEKRSESIDNALRWWWVPLISMIVAGTIAGGLATQRESQFTASASLMFRDQQLDQKLFGNSFSAPNNDQARRNATNLELVQTDSALRAAARELSMPVETLRPKLEFLNSGQSDIIRVQATDPSPRRAAVLANEYARAFIESRKKADRAAILEAQASVERQLAELAPSDRSSDARSLRNRADQLRVFATLQTGNAEIVAEATPPKTRSTPKPLRDALLGAFAGAALGILVAVLLARFDKRIRTEEEIEELTGLPIIGRIQESPRLAADDHVEIEPQTADSLRALRARMRYLQGDARLQVIAVNSGVPGEGKSTAAEILTRVAGEAPNSKAVLIEADMRAPQLTRRLSLRPGVGLAEYLSHQADIADIMQPLPRIAPGSNQGIVEVIPAGATPPNPLVLLESSRWTELVAELRKTYDLIVIDVPPLALVPDAIAVARDTDGVLVVVSMRHARRDAIQRMLEELRNIHAHPIGVVINRHNSRRVSYGYSYGRGGADTALEAGDASTETGR